VDIHESALAMGKPEPSASQLFRATHLEAANKFSFEVAAQISGEHERVWTAQVCNLARKPREW
jgi:hypothetical protein